MLQKMNIPMPMKGLKVTHTKTCVDHHIQSTKYMHPWKGKKEEGDKSYVVPGFCVQSHCLRGSFSGTCTGEWDREW